jgi:hypothetical protein
MIEILTGTGLDCRPWYISSSPAFWWSETTIKLRGSEGVSRLAFFYVLYEAQNNLQDVYEGIGFFKYIRSLSAI